MEKNNSLSHLVNIFKDVARKIRFDRIMLTFVLQGFKKIVLEPQVGCAIITEGNRCIL